ncbi:MAG: hypothetical protein PVI33_03855 [Candidatus Omnitrophota bacterium]|jgi:hypothetical protein
MNLEEKWNQALSKTEIIRIRISYLSTFDATALPYIFLAESVVNLGDTVVRRGKILVHRPAIVLPEDMPQFEGFEFEKEFEVNADMVRMFLLVRGVSFPSLKYEHEISKLDIYEGSLKKAKTYFKQRLERSEDVQTGLIIGSEDTWQLSLLIYVGLLIGKSVPSDLRKLWERFKGKFPK